MAYSSILGADPAPQQPSGREAELLGPSDNSDSGSDTIGTHEAHADSDSRGTGERGAVAGPDQREGGDILPDRVVNLSAGEVSPESDAEAEAMTDLDSASDDGTASSEDEGDEEAGR
jgi:hypothetical protein